MKIGKRNANKIEEAHNWCEIQINRLILAQGCYSAGDYWRLENPVNIESEHELQSCYLSKEA